MVIKFKAKNQKSMNYLETRGDNIKNIIAVIIIVSIGGVMLAGLSACTEEEPAAETEVKEETTEDKVELVYVEWDSEIASTHVVAEVIEAELGYEVDLMAVTLTALYEAIAMGDQDGMVAAWLPLQKEYYEQHQDDLIHLGPNLEGTIEGLAVPEYVPINSISELPDYKERFDGKIIGIEPDAGIMDATRRAIEEYEDLEKFDLITGSDHTMTTTLENAVENEEWIVVTGWTPHWKFSMWDLKYLDDPRGIYDEEGYIGTIVREGLEEDMPEVYRFMNNFYWQEEDMEEVMLWIEEEDKTPGAAAERFREENPDMVQKWLEE